jgi:aryl-alcohol dehydrogenase-like predicted oxidoreductase
MADTKFNSESAKEARAKAAPRGESKIRKLIRELADNESTIDVFNKLKDLAKAGDMDAIKTYLAYVVGKPKDTVVFTGDEEKPITFKLDERFLKQLLKNGKG